MGNVSFELIQDQSYRSWQCEEANISLATMSPDKPVKAPEVKNVSAGGNDGRSITSQAQVLERSNVLSQLMQLRNNNTVAFAGMFAQKFPESAL